VDAWYSLFDPLGYAHSIGPAQVALGGLGSPKQFSEVMSYANSIGAIEKENEKPICHPAEAFHVALFRTPDGSVANVQMLMFSHGNNTINHSSGWEIWNIRML
jgi:hypothetical protein